MFLRKVDDLFGSRQVAAQIVFFKRRFSKIHGSNRHPRKPRRGGSERHRGEEMLEVREHVLLAEVAHPDTRIGTIGHSGIIQATGRRTENVRARQSGSVSGWATIWKILH